MPSNQSRPSASDGASEASDAAAVTRPGSSAAQASRCGPPPEMPHMASRPMPRSAQMARTSAAQSATARPGWGVEPP